MVLSTIVAEDDSVHEIGRFEKSTREARSARSKSLEL